MREKFVSPVSSVADLAIARNEFEQVKLKRLIDAAATVPSSKTIAQYKRDLDRRLTSLQSIRLRWESHVREKQVALISGESSTVAG